jgi:hypothetical protein
MRGHEAAVDPCRPDPGAGGRQRLRELIGRRCGLPAAGLGDDLELGGLGLDSVALVELLLDCEALAARRLPPGLFAAAPPTVGDLLEHLAPGGDER